MSLAYVVSLVQQGSLVLYTPISLVQQGSLAYVPGLCSFIGAAGLTGIYVPGLCSFMGAAGLTGIIYPYFIGAARFTGKCPWLM